LNRLVGRSLVGSSDEDRAVLLDVDLGAGLLDDLVDVLALGTDHFTDLVGRHLDGLDTRSARLELLAGRAQCLVHLRDDVQASVARLHQGGA
jgi:hypothetical protein